MTEEATGLVAAVDMAIADFDCTAGRLVSRAQGAVGAAAEVGVTLSTLAREGDTFKLSGSAPTFDATSMFADRLVRTGLFASADVLSVERGGRGDVTFNMVVTFASSDEPLGSEPAVVR